MIVATKPATTKARLMKVAGRWIGHLILLFVSLSVSLLLGEGLVRLLAPQSLILLRPDIWSPAETIGWRHQALANTQVNMGEREVHFITDEQGFRIGSTPQSPGDLTLVALGDSYVSALQVEYEETMTELLANRLSARSGKRVRILNTGVEGWDPNQYRIEAKRILENRHVDGFLVYVYLGNDIVQYRYDGVPARQQVERHNFKIPTKLNWPSFVGGIAYPLNDFLEVRSHLFIFMRNRLRFVLMRLNLSAYGFPEFLRVAHVGSNAWPVTAHILKEIDDLGRERHIKTLFILIPPEEEADLEEGRKTAEAWGFKPGSFDLDQAHRIMEDELKKLNLPVVDGTPSLRAAIERKEPDVFGDVDNHLGKTGHRIMAQITEEPAWQMFVESTDHYAKRNN